MPTIRREYETEAVTWEFGYDHGKGLVLWTWKRETRKSKRHVWRADERWDALRSGPEYGSPARPRIPFDVAHEARRMFIESLKVEGEGPAPQSVQYGPMPPDFAHDPDGSARAAWEAKRAKGGRKR